MNFSEDLEFSGQDDAFLREVDFDIEFVDGHPVLQVAVKAVRFLHQKRADRGMRPEKRDHCAERDAASLFRRLYVNVFVGDSETLRRRVFLQQL